MRKRISMVSLLLALGATHQAWAQAQVIADSGFRPKPHGFAFENWGGQKYPYSKITPDDAALAPSVGHHAGGLSPARKHPLRGALPVLLPERSGCPCAFGGFLGRSSLLTDGILLPRSGYFA